MLQRNHAPSHEPLFINLTPMIDVILTLLVFFITASRLYDWEAEEEQLQVAIPTVGYAQPLTGMPDDLVIVVERDGSLHVGAEPITLRELGPRLRAAKQNFSRQGAIVRADGSTTHQHVADVLSVLQSAGIERIRLSVHEIGAE